MNAGPRRYLHKFFPPHGATRSEIIRLVIGTAIGLFIGAGGVGWLFKHFSG